mmetsp:Transcript_53484/g.106113  ORF Transcript_53484/g.106113 Transcript_53484/m.106113 type:complete len:201 (-) Transcript_53484:369-971(-)
MSASMTRFTSRSKGSKDGEPPSSSPQPMHAFSSLTGISPTGGAMGSFRTGRRPTCVALTCDDCSAAPLLSVSPSVSSLLSRAVAATNFFVLPFGTQPTGGVSGISAMSLASFFSRSFAWVALVADAPNRLMKSCSFEASSTCAVYKAMARFARSVLSQRYFSYAIPLYASKLPPLTSATESHAVRSSSSSCETSTTVCLY